MDRRDFFKAVTAGAVLVAAGRSGAARAVGRSAEASPVVREDAPFRRIRPAPEAAAPTHLVAPWTVGEDVGEGWTLAAVTPVIEGGFELRFVNGGGATARVAVCRLEPGRPVGVAQSRSCDLLLVNMGGGREATDASVERLIRRAADVVARREDAGAVVPAAVRSYRERVTLHGPEALL